MKRFQRLNRLQKAGFIVLTLTFAIGVTWLLTGMTLESRIAREREALARLGAIMSTEELEALSLHEGKDAWPHLEKVVTLIEAQKLEPMEELLRKAPQSPTSLKAAKGYVDAFKPAYEDLVRASHCEVIKFKPGWFRAGIEESKRVDRYDDVVIPGDTVSLVPEQVTSARRGLHLYAYAICLGRLGRTDEAVEVYETIRRLGKLQRSTPGHESLQFWFTDQQYGDRIALGLARENSSNVEFLQKLVAATETYEPPSETRYYLLGEAFHAEMALSDEEWVGNEPDFGPILLHFARFRRLLVLRQFRRWREVLEQVDESHSMDKLLATSDRATLKIEQEEGWVADGLAYTSPYVGQWNSLSKNTAAHRNATITMLLLMIDRAKTGRFPTKLPSYGGSSVDPFTGGKLKMLIKDDQLVIYSVGENGMDDKGSRGDVGRVTIPLDLGSG